MNVMMSKLRAYWILIKSPQTGLLLVTGLAGYMSASCPVMHWMDLLGLAGSLFLAISGSTVLNMFFDRDIDAKMKRTACRPLPSGKVSPGEVLRLGLLLSSHGVIWAVALDPLYGLIVFTGLFFDIVVYTIWLKKRTAWAILWGGISGGMPILAGRTLGIGHIDWIGIALATAVLFWIPTHIVTFNIKYHADYQQAKLPTIPSAYGFQTARNVIVVSSLLAAFSIGLAAIGIGMSWGFLRLLIVLSGVLLALASLSLIRPSERMNLGLFKYASLYMLSAMVLLTINAF